MKYFVSRNRREEPNTTLLDAWEDNAYLGVCSGYEVVNGEIVIKWPTQNDSTQSAMVEADNKVNQMNAVEVAPGVYLSQDLMGKIAPKVEEFTGEKSFTAEFDWQLGHEVIEGFASVGAAKGYQDEVLKKFAWANITNFKVYEVKSVRKELN